MHHYALGELNPLPTLQLSAEEIRNAFRCMEKCHEGRIAVLMPEDSSSFPVSSTRRTPTFRSEAMHILVGGLGGIGRSVSSWMARHGARHFVFFSPSAAGKARDEFVLELRAQGCRVDLISGDISNYNDVDQLIQSLDRNTPIAGLMQASMILEVASIADMSYRQWNESSAPKVQGTWNLHNALLKHRRPTDYFLLFSSLSGLTGQTGHANYAAGNSFLDAFAQYRHSLGLPCSVLDTGVVEDVGHVSNQRGALEHFAATSTHALLEQDLFDVVQLAIDNSVPRRDDANLSEAWPSYVNHSQICIGLRSTTPLDCPTNRIPWRRDPRMAIYHNMSRTSEKNKPTSKETEQDRTLGRFLKEAKSKPQILFYPASANTLGAEIGKALFGFMLRDSSELDLDIPLPSLGVDSLLAIRLKEWLRQTLEMDVSVVQILGSPGLRELGRKAAQSLADKSRSGER